MCCTIWLWVSLRKSKKIDPHAQMSGSLRNWHHNYLLKALKMSHLFLASNRKSASSPASLFGFPLLKFFEQMFYGQMFRLFAPLQEPNWAKVTPFEFSSDHKVPAKQY